MDLWHLLRHLDQMHGYVPQGRTRVLDSEYIKLMSKHSVMHSSVDTPNHKHERLGRAVSWVVEEVTDPYHTREEQ